MRSVAPLALVAQALSMRSLAEGVETVEELAAAVRAGCKKVQGFYFTRPVPVCELGDVMSVCQQKLAIAA